MSKTILITLLLLPFISYVQSNIDGFVLDKTTNQPLKGATINLYIKTDASDSIGVRQEEGINYKKVAATVSDEKGYYSFANLTPNNYSLSCFYPMEKKEKGCTRILDFHVW